jgi:hypothetical protein
VTPTATPTPTLTPTQARTATLTPTPTTTLSQTPSPTPTPTDTTTATVTATPTFETTPIIAPTPSPSPTPGRRRHPTFRILHADCGVAPSVFDFFTNDVLIGSVPSSAGCECSTEPLEVTFTDDTTLPPSDPGLCDVYRVTVRDGGAAVRLGEVQVTVDTEQGELGGCLFDGSATNAAPACAARALCDAPGFTEGVGAVEGSICPVCGTGSVGSVAQDLDGDRIGNTCDDTDAVLGIQRATVHANTARRRPNGFIVWIGDVEPAAVTDTFNAANGLVIRVTDGLALDRTFAFSPEECRRRVNGFVSCKSVDGQSHAIVTPHRKPARFHVAVAFRQLDLSGPFQPDLTVRLTDDPPVPVEGIDRVGAIGDCTVMRHGMRCQTP